MSATDEPALLSRGAVLADLVRVETAVWNHIDRRTRSDHGMPLARFYVLQVVGSTPGCRVQDVADRLMISVGGASKLVDRLEAATLVRRLDAADRRSRTIEVTTTGAALLEKISTDIDRQLARSGPELGSDAWTDLASALAPFLAHVASEARSQEDKR